ncbi:MAG TPA: GNAT family N-acetyltransferase [Parachlamydiaceae bacterium]|nr:GNAT family N-acetyltransferase [Parachlamydiaceae bacterium]
MSCNEDSKYRFEYQQEPIQEDIQILFEGINDESVLKKKMERINSFGIFIKDAEGIVLGGLNGVTYYGCLYVDMLWVNAKWRDQGLGNKLMMDAEKIGRERQCSFATVNTMDWEALTFYQKLGYDIEFVREGYVKQSKMYMLRKKL